MTMLAEKILEENKLNTTSELSALDRCDYCNSRAYVKAVKGTFELFFCGHDAMKNIEKLQKEGWLIEDHTF